MSTLSSSTNANITFTLPNYASGHSEDNLTTKEIHGETLTKILDVDQGIVEAFVSGVGNKDSGNDIIVPGAFDKWLKKRMPKGVWSHDWDRPIAKTLEIYEVPAGDGRLPMKMLANGIGGLYVKCQFNLSTEEGRNAFLNVKFFEDEAEWSIGYKVHKQHWDQELKANILEEIELFEYSPVLFGMNPLTATASVKSTAVDHADVSISFEDLTLDQVNDLKGLIEEFKGHLQSKGAVRSHETSTSQSGWDGPANERRVKQDESASYYRRIYAWQDPDGDVGAKSTWRFIHHEVNGDGDPGAANIRACQTGIGVLNGGRGGTTIPTADRKGVYNHLARHLRDAGLEPPELKSLEDIISSVESDDENQLSTETGEKMSEKTIKGSFEEKYETIAQALKNEFKEIGYAFPVATFESSVVAFVANYQDGSEGYFQASYNFDGEGAVKFGTFDAVDVVEVVVAKSAIAEYVELAKKSDDDVATKMAEDLLVAPIEEIADENIKEYTVTEINGLYYVIEGGKVCEIFASEELANLYVTYENAEEAYEEAADAASGDKSTDEEVETKDAEDVETNDESTEEVKDAEEIVEEISEEEVDGTKGEEESVVETSSAGEETEEEVDEASDEVEASKEAVEEKDDEESVEDTDDEVSEEEVDDEKSTLSDAEFLAELAEFTQLEQELLD